MVVGGGVLLTRELKRGLKGGWVVALDYIEHRVAAGFVRYNRIPEPKIYKENSIYNFFRVAIP